MRSIEKITSTTMALFATTAFTVMTAVMVMMSSTSSLQAATYLELDFQNVGSGQTTAVQSAGTSQFELLNNASIGTAASGPTVPISSINTGMLSVPRANDADTSGLKSFDTGTTNNRYRDFVDSSSNLGTTTLTMIYRPNFDGAAAGNNYLFAHRVYGNSRSVNVAVQSNGVFLRVAGNTVITTSLADSATWDSDSWYMISASWSVGNTAHVYVREIADGSSGSSNTSTDLTPTTDNFSWPIFIGQATSVSDPTGESANGDFAYLLWNDDYTTSTAGFDAIYDGLTTVPEPGSLALLTIGAVMIAGRKRNRTA